MPTWLWPVQTGKTLIDVWTVAHLAFWIFIGSTLWSLKWPSRPWLMVGCLAAALTWEAFERWAEPRYPHLWLDPEAPINSYVSDLATVVVGLLVMWWLLDHWR